MAKRNRRMSLDQGPGGDFDLCHELIDGDCGCGCRGGDDYDDEDW